MPSGAKKRKAAKKKQQLQAKEYPSRSDSFLARSHGEEDLKHDDKESDSEGGSPSSQDNQNHQNQFTEGEVENGDKQLDVSHDQSIDENKPIGVKHEGEEVEIVGNEDGGDLQVERELKVEGESESQKINVEYVGGLQRSSSGNSSSSSNSSLEKHDVADKSNVVVDDAPAVELVKEIKSLSDTLVADSLVGTASTSDLDKAAISEDVVQMTTTASDADYVSASTVEQVVKEKGEENMCIVDEKDTASATVVENSEENLGSIVEEATISEGLVETGSEKRDEAASAVSNGNAIENTDAQAFATLENEETIEAPHNAPKIDAVVSVDNVRESPALECHDHQVTTLPSQPVQTASWKSCCGLFELFAGSN